MATFTAIQAGNWNAWQTWFAGDPGGGEGSQYPGNGDVADCAGFAVTMNLTTTPASGTLAEMKSTGAGYFRWDNTAGAAMTVNCTKFTVGGTGAGTAGVFQVNSTTAGYTLTINSSNTSGEGIVGATGGTNSYGFVKTTGTQTFTFKGRIKAGSAGHGMYLANASGAVYIEGNIYGNDASASVLHGIWTNAALTLNVACGELVAGTASCAIANTGTGAATYNLGPLAPATSFELVGAIRSPAVDTKANAVTTVNITSDCFFDESAGVAYVGVAPIWTPTPNEMITLGTNKFAALVAAADLKSGVVNGDVTGTYKGGAGARMKQIGIGVF